MSSITQRLDAALLAARVAADVDLLSEIASIFYLSRQPQRLIALMSEFGITFDKDSLRLLDKARVVYNNSSDRSPVHHFSMQDLFKLLLEARHRDEDHTYLAVQSHFCEDFWFIISAVRGADRMIIHTRELISSEIPQSNDVWPDNDWLSRTPDEVQRWVEQYKEAVGSVSIGDCLITNIVHSVTTHFLGE